MSSSPNTPAQRKLDAELYRKAARLIERKAQDTYTFSGTFDFSCHALGAVAANHKELCLRMFHLFNDRGDAEDDAWLAGICAYDDFEQDHREDPEERDRPGRVLALCFMAAMVEAGDA